MDAATLVVVFLLVTLASLASYLLSQWSFIRNGNISIVGWVAISIGTTLLLGAAAVVMLTVGLLPKLPMLPNIELVERTLRSTQLGGETAERAVDQREAPSDALSATRSAAPTDRRVRPAQGQLDDRSGSAAAAQSSQQPAAAFPETKSGAVSPGAGLIFTEADPWAATHCVYAFNPDPADLTVWRIENECGAPVGIVFASCPESPPGCGRDSTSWKYQLDGMILPGRWQRPVTAVEETQYGAQIRYVACLLATHLAIELITQSREIRSSPSWLAQFDGARNDDECLVLVQRWSTAGRTSGQSIDVLLQLPPRSMHLARPRLRATSWTSCKPGRERSIPDHRCSFVPPLSIRNQGPRKSFLPISTPLWRRMPYAVVT